MAAIDSYVRALGESIGENGDCYLLIDPYLREPLAAALAEIPEANQVTVPVQHPALAADQRPRLIKVRATDTGLLKTSVIETLNEQTDPEREARDGWTIGGWLCTNQPVDRLARHLARIMQMRAPAESRNRYLRWADPRVMAWLWPALNTTQQAQLLGPITCWRALNRVGHWSMYESSADRSIVSAQPNKRLHLTAEQWQIAEQGEQVHAMIRGWQMIADTLPDDYLAQAAKTVGYARDAGVTHTADVVALGAYGLQVHPGLAWHPRIQSCIRQAADTGAPLADYLGAIEDPEGWGRIRDELDEPESAAPIRSTVG